MSESNHTKGPWSNTGLEIRNQAGMILANVYKHLESNQSKEEALANAKVVAAGPEMLDALKSMSIALTGHPIEPDEEEAFEKMRLAILKADSE